MSERGARSPRDPDFYRRPVLEVAEDLVGCVLSHAGASGTIVETEAYHVSEAACHAYVGLTARTRVLFGAPGNAYVYRSYGIHALLNTVVEEEGIGAAVLIRALEPLDGIDLMRERRGLRGGGRPHDLCSGPGKLTQALGIELDANDTRIGDAIEVAPRRDGVGRERVVTGERIGITKAVDLPWRFCNPDSRCVSKPWPPAMRHQPIGGRRAG